MTFPLPVERCRVSRGFRIGCLPLRRCRRGLVRQARAQALVTPGAAARRLPCALPVSACSRSFTESDEAGERVAVAPCAVREPESAQRDFRRHRRLGAGLRSEVPHAESNEDARRAMPDLGLHFVGIAEQKIRRCPLGAKVAFRAIAIEAGVRGGHRGSRIPRRRAGPDSRRAQPWRAACRKRRGSTTPRAQHPGGPAAPASSAPGGMPTHRSRRTCPRGCRAPESSIAFRADAKSSTHDEACGPVAIAPAQFDALERIAVGAACMDATAQRRQHRHALCAARFETPRVEIEVAQRRLAVDLETIDHAAGHRAPDHEQSAFQGYAAIGRRWAMTCSGIRCADCRAPPARARPCRRPGRSGVRRREPRLA